MRKFSTAVIGGGAAGITAAISAATQGRSVVICEKMPRLGKKILASGNGRCNLLNLKLDESHYNKSSRSLVKNIFAKFGKKEIEGFFKNLGLQLYPEGDRIFPATNQSSSVLKILEMELKRLSVNIEPDFAVSGISPHDGGFMVTSGAGDKIACDKVIIAGGGRSYPALGSDGSAYKLVSAFGHKLITPVPVAVSLNVKDPMCHLLQGQKIFAKARSIIGGVMASEASGELLFTKYGLSGTAILDVSEEISIAVNRNRKDAAVSVDMVPFLAGESLRNEIEARLKKKLSAEDLLAGILPNKFGNALKELCHNADPHAISAGLKDRRFKVVGTRGWNEAEFTAGGIDTDEVSPLTLESKLKKGLYLAGEILDVNGRRGGYNLAWAWASGFVAGLAG